MKDWVELLCWVGVILGLWVFGHLMVVIVSHL